jgi:phosphogluconate dehydratase
LARVYPNGLADVNHFHAAGGMGFLIKQLLKGGYLHDDVRTVYGQGLQAYTVDALLGENGTVARQPAPDVSHDPKVLSTVETPFQETGGLKMLSGNLGRAVIKISAVKPERHVIEAPAIVFNDQQELQDAFKAGKLDRDFVGVVRFQGPKANGMPELHRLTPPLGVLQDRGFKVALLTDGRMSGASGKVPAAIHLTPEAVDQGPISLVQNGDIIRIDAITGAVDLLVPAEELAKRVPATLDLSANEWGMGRELFAPFRRAVGAADHGASIFH